MCGFAGFIDFSRESKREFLLGTVERMTDTLVHRGPDDKGLWADAAAGAVFGFRRLAILDLSPLGAQPMQSAGGEERFTAIFNGEIYNFLELRAELESLGHSFRGHSDTEIMLAGFIEWGVEATVKKLNGMFAIAVWDAGERELFLIRDRIGKKPLYYARFGDFFLFGSELKALRAHPAFVGEVDRDALAAYLKFGYVPNTQSIYRNVQKLAPASILKVSPEKNEIAPQKNYWSVTEAALAGLQNPLGGSDAEILDELEILLRDAVKRRMLADVPLGAFLSGGIDSSIVVALMQAQSASPVKTFSIGFHEDQYNEAQHAKRVAAHLGTQHEELYVTTAEAQAVIPQLPEIYDEPFADSSQIPTFLVSRLARKYVTVALSGDGGDEFFGGYGRYLRVDSIWSKLKNLPAPLRGASAAAVGFGGSLAALVSPKNEARQQNLAQKLSYLSELMPAADFDSLYANFTALWSEPEKILTTRNAPEIGKLNGAGARLNAIEKMMLGDARRYLPDDILVKVDRASMRVSLEARAPLLDYRVAELAWRVPFRLKVKPANGGGKWLLKQLLYRHVPREIAERPKMGFDVPIAAWLRGDLREWAENLLDENRLRREGFFNPAPVRQVWAEHLAGKRNHQHALWAVLMFQAWLENVKN